MAFIKERYSSDNSSELEERLLEEAYTDHPVRGVDWSHFLPSVLFTVRKVRVFLMLVGLGALVILANYLAVRNGEPSETQLASPVVSPDRLTKWVKPTGFKIVAVVFFGRPHSVDVLDCYLQRNLAINRNGGYLDEVHFLQRTSNQHDIAWLDRLVATRPAYKIIDEEGITKDCENKDGKLECHPGSYSNMWKHLVQNDTMYLKIDDDVVSTLSLLSLLSIR